MHIQQIRQHWRKATAQFVVAVSTMIAVGAAADADLWVNGGFEDGPTNIGWTGTDTFHINSAATVGALPTDNPPAKFNDFVHDRLVSEPGTWVEDPAHAFAGDRMFWLSDYNDPDTICVGHTFDSLVAGSTLELTWNFAAFNPIAASGSAADFVMPAVELSYRDSVTNQFIVLDQVIDFGSGGVTDPDNGNFEMFAMQDWDNLNWDSGISLIDVPETNGEEITIWVSYLSDSDARNPLPESNNAGLLIDNIQLRAVPEPGSLTLAGVGIIWISLRRRRQS